MSSPSGSKNRWTPEDEWALSLLMQKRMNADTTGSFGPPSLPEKGGYGLKTAGAMHDGSKRRLVADSETSAEWEQVDASGPSSSYAGRVRPDDTALEEAIIAALDASPVIGAAAAQEVSFGQYKAKYSYQEVATDKTLWDYRKWVRTHINQRTSKGAALDFAKYLKAHDARHGQVKQMPVIPGTAIPRQFKEDDP
ncbi:unnamed protein product [Durusdinium trenchii]|uniref:Uncharacterized protein n=1 Tax=Durusdinium trenchii TaxID=1381693 RepID=A0ABP0HHN2_9DINO